MILVDTSVWIDFFAGKHIKATDSLIKAIDASNDICTCGVVMTEVLQGIRSDTEFERIKNILSGLIYLPITKNTFTNAAQIYRTIRKKGKTIRSPVDCIISSLCIEHDVAILNNDRDFSVIAQYTSLNIMP